jgi:hypothetical protein
MIIKRCLQPAIITIACNRQQLSSNNNTLKKTSFNQKLIIQFLMGSFSTTTKRSSDFVFIINIFIIWCLPLLPMTANLQWQQQQQKTTNSHQTHHHHMPPSNEYLWDNNKSNYPHQYMTPQILLTIISSSSASSS